MSRIGLTGATGVLGSAVQQHWGNAVAFTGDVRDLQALREWASNGPFDAVLHLAAIVPVAIVESDPLAAFEVNVQGTWNVMEALHGSDAWIFFASSSHVYLRGGLYGVTKRMAEEAVLAYRDRACVGRIFSFSALAQPASYLIPGLIERIRHAAPNARMELRGAHNVRDFLSTRCIVSAMQTLYAHRARGTFDIGSGEGITVMELARKLAARMNRTDLQFVSVDDEQNALVADPSPLRDMGWRCDGALDELLEEMTQ